MERFISRNEIENLWLYKSCRVASILTLYVIFMLCITSNLYADKSFFLSQPQDVPWISLQCLFKHPRCTALSFYFSQSFLALWMLHAFVALQDNASFSRLCLHFHVAFKFSINRTFTTCTKSWFIIHVYIVAHVTNHVSFSWLNCLFHVLTSQTDETRRKLDGCNASARWKRGESVVKATLENGESLTRWK